MNEAAGEVLSLTNITRTYQAGKPGEVSVLRGVNLQVKRGELVALIAPSGAGKSTLLHVCGLLDRPNSGMLRVLGNEIGSDDKTRTTLRRKHIGFVYQFHHLLPEFTALENVVLPQLADGVARSAAEDRAARLLGEVGLSARQDHRPSELSGGEQQRVAFCRALANEPQLLLADEPTGNLDPETAETVFSQMVAMSRATGLSALVATHNPQLAARMDRVLKLSSGVLEPA